MSKVCFFVLASSVPIFCFSRKYLGEAAALFLAYLPVNAVVTGFGVAQMSALATTFTTLAAVSPFYFADTETLKKGLKYVSYASVVISVYAIMQIFKYDPIFIYVKLHDLGTPVSTFGQQTVLGSYLAISLAASIYSRHWLVCLLTAVVLAKTGSSFTYAAGVAVCLPFAFRWYPRLTLTSIVSIMVVLYIAYTYTASGRHFLEPALMDNGRFDMWEAIYDAHKSSGNYYEMVGVGLGSFKYTFLNVQPEELINKHGIFLYAHNEFLEALYELGMIGFVLVLFLVGYVLYLVYRAFDDEDLLPFGAILLGVLANAIGNFPLHLQPHASFAAISFIVIARRIKPLVR